jgi:hypothetical protein
MRVGHLLVAVALNAMCACNGTKPQGSNQSVNNAENPMPASEAPPGPQPARESPSAPSAPISSPTPSRVSVPMPKSSLPEPKGPIDPKSVEAAGQVVQWYGALIEQKRWAEAKALWGNPGIGATFQAQALSGNKENHIEIGDLGLPEGAAGSIFVTMPVTFYGTGGDGQPYRKRQWIVLRRVNDVPGSTEAQRRWHIERIDSSAP